MGGGSPARSWERAVVTVVAGSGRSTPEQLFAIAGKLKCGITSVLIQIDNDGTPSLVAIRHPVVLVDGPVISI
jgi:hypothetical protein